MKIIEYVRLGECAICPYSVKKLYQKIKCDWDEKGKNLMGCERIKKCGNFPDVEKIVSTIDILNIDVR